MTPSDHRILLCMIRQSEVLSRVLITVVTRDIGCSTVRNNAMGVRTGVGVLLALQTSPVVQGCAVQRGNISLRPPITRWERSHLLKLLDSLREPIPNSLEPFTPFQGREGIDHSLCHGFRTGLIEVEWHSMNIQTCKRAPWERARLLDRGSSKMFLKSSTMFVALKWISSFSNLTQ